MNHRQTNEQIARHTETDAFIAIFFGILCAACAGAAGYIESYDLIPGGPIAGTALISGLTGASAALTIFGLKQLNAAKDIKDFVPKKKE